MYYLPYTPFFYVIARSPPDTDDFRDKNSTDVTIIKARIRILCDILYLLRTYLLLLLLKYAATSTRDDRPGRGRGVLIASCRAVSGPKINSTVRAVGQQEVKINPPRRTYMIGRKTLYTMCDLRHGGVFTRYCTDMAKTKNE